MGSVGQSDNSGVVPKSRNVKRVQLRNVHDIERDSIEQLVSAFGTVLRFDTVNDGGATNVIVSFESAEQAHSAATQLDGYELNGVKVEAELMDEESSGQTQHTDGAARRHASNGVRPAGYPLRILIPNELVGAVIGKKGVVIRNITTECKARVDVHGKESSGVIEKMISIFGQPENCSSACREILNVIHNEPAIQSRGGLVPLKMLIDDRYCGRIIGKEGKIVKKIRDDTNTKISISSSVQEMAVVYPDRVVTIQGTVDNMVAAQAAISVKLAECIEKDVHGASGLGSVMMMTPGSVPVLPGGPYSQNVHHLYTGQHSGTSGYLSCTSAQGHIDVSQIVVPDKAVGAIIGSGGTMIKQIMEDSGAHVTVEAKKDADGTNSTLERLVTIRGNTDACWKASYFVFEKVRDESAGRAGAGDCAEIKLRTLLSVPRGVAGRIIGRQGRNVREIQRMTGAAVKLTDDDTATDETTAEVYGNFMATQGALARIRALISEELMEGTAASHSVPSQPAASRRAIQPLA